MTMRIHQAPMTVQKSWRAALLLGLLLAAGADTSAEEAHYDTCQRHSALQDLQQELRAHNASLRLLAPFGAEVSGLDLVARVRSGELQHGKGLAATIESAMARTGVVVFRGQGLLSGDDQVAIR
jgi:hypothetical protein